MNENFIPISIKTLIKNLLKNNNNKDLKKVFSLIIAIYNYKINQKLTSIKENYQNFNPDLELVVEKTDRKKTQSNLIDSVSELLTYANYRKINKIELEQAIKNKSNIGLNINVDLGDYEVFNIYYRGLYNKNIVIKKYFNLIKKDIKTDIYNRVFIIAKLKNKNTRARELSNIKNISLVKAQKKVNKLYKKLPNHINDNVIFFKLFKNIPSKDLETLFFMRTIKFKLFDKLKLIITGSISTTTGVIATIGKIAIALNPIAILSAIGGMIGVIVKQITNLFNQHSKYLNTLNTRLYFHNLGNNLSAISYIANSSFEEEVKEIILGYYFLSQNNYNNIIDLDKDIEKYLLNTYNLEIDFEIEDSIHKLKNIGLLDNNLNLKNVDNSIKILQDYWGNLI